MSVYKVLLSVYRALLIVYMALLSSHGRIQGSFDVYRALLGVCRCT